MSARALAQNSSHIIGVVLKFIPKKELNALQDPFAGELMGALEACIREAGYYMMLHVASSVQEIVHLMQTWNVDGLVLTGFHAQDYRQIRSQSQKRGCPIRRRKTTSRSAPAGPSTPALPGP